MYLALVEAKDIAMHLKPLRPCIEDFEQADFENSEKVLAPILHVVCLIWANCEHYQIPSRIVVLLQEISNLVISQVATLIFIGKYQNI